MVERTPKILIVDDDPRLRDLLRRYLGENGFNVLVSENGEAMKRLWVREHFDVLILDLMMPGEDGLAILKRLRAEKDMTPVIILTARGEDVDRILGLELGADDYLGKPFSFNEFEARVSAILRRTAPEKLMVEDLVYDLLTHRATRAGNPLKIKGIAQRILEELMKASPEIVDREHLTAAIWPDDDVPDADSLRANIYLLRQAVDKPFATALIRTHTGAGWSIGRSQR